MKELRKIFVRVKSAFPLENGSSEIRISTAKTSDSGRVGIEQLQRWIPVPSAQTRPCEEENPSPLLFIRYAFCLTVECLCIELHIDFPPPTPPFSNLTSNEHMVCMLTSRTTAAVSFSEKILGRTSCFRSVQA